MNAIECSTLAEVVWVDPERMGGIACFRGTRVPVEFIFDWLGTGETIDYFLEQYPSVTRDQAVAVMQWAKLKVCEEMGALETFA
ncbi:MAG: DUF433 domain-containing protein [Planctomycetota bacterium]